MSASGAEFIRRIKSQVEEVDPAEVSEVAWSRVARIDGTHPLLAAAPSSHELTPADDGADCGGCTKWRTWQVLADAKAQLWYGFGGAWGEVGRSDLTTGPLGPHGFFLSAAEKLNDPSEN